MSKKQIDRRDFMRQTMAFSAMGMLGPRAAFAKKIHYDHEAAELLIVGDWGYQQTQEQELVARGMVQYAHNNRLKVQALLMLGDNWYEDLPGGADSPRWKSHFEDLYPKDIFPGPAYAVLGNHDYQFFPMSKVDAELEYARRGKSRWTMPSKWYSFDFPKNSPLIHFIALDSNMPHRSEAYSSKPVIDFTLTEAERQAQQKWLEMELQKPRTTPFTVVIAHHPLYSNGTHGDHAVLIRDWDPLLRKHGVHAYLAGHDHDLQHLEFEGHPTSFFLSGGGGAVLHDLKIAPEKRGPHAQKVSGFSRLSVTSNVLRLQHLDAYGNVLHALEKSPDGTLTILS